MKTPLCAVALALLPLATPSFAPSQQAPLQKAWIDGEGWTELTLADFVNVNGDDDTWTERDGSIVCTGKPLGGARSRKEYTNFELVLEWKHHTHAGNSGVFLWCPESAFTDLPPGKLPRSGIEVQVLDLGYEENWEKSKGAPSDWFTSHGDVFPVGASTMTALTPTLEYRTGEDEVDFMLCEIGGTVGDIEGLPFFEAIRQFSQDKPRGQCIFMHLTLLPYLAASSELKTKPTQHSVKELRSIGLQPDVLVCRSEHEIPEKERAKIALFCNVRPEAVIPAYDLKSIYEAPLAYHKVGLDQAVLDAFQIAPAPKPNLDRWEDVMDRLENAEGEVRVAIVGKYIQLEDAYKSIAEALTHGGMANRVKVRAEWIDAEIFEREDPAPHLERFHAILVPGGFGERGTEGKIRAAEFAREKKIPYLGICLGMQMAVIEAARNIAGIKGAGSEEFDHEAGKKRFEPVVYHLKEWVQGNQTVQRKVADDKGGTMRLGAYTANLSAGSRVAQVYGETVIEERHRHRYEVDIKYRDALEAEGLSFSGMSPDGRLPEIVEWKDHPWFIGVQFHPELKSKPFAPHPLFADFVRAAVEVSRLV